jgi:hypothetical protein
MPKAHVSPFFSFEPSDNEEQDPFNKKVPSHTLEPSVNEEEDPFNNMVPSHMPSPPPSIVNIPLLPPDTYHTFVEHAELTVFLVKTENPYLTHTKLMSALGLGKTSLKIISNTADISRLKLSAKMGWAKSGVPTKLIPFLDREEMQSLAKNRLHISAALTNSSITAKANELNTKMVFEFTAFSIKNIMIDKQTERRDSREVATRNTELNTTSINTASVDHDLFVVYGVVNVKRRINTLEKSDTVTGVPRLGAGDAAHHLED